MNVIPRPSLKKLTTIGIGSCCEGLIEVRDIKDMERALNFVDRKKIKPVFLGKGSNVIPAREYIPCFLIKLKGDDNFEIVRETEDRVWIRVMGGSSLRRFISWCVKNGFMGIEGLVGIPGSIGGSLYMNAGSFGYEISDVVHEITIWHIDLGILNYTRDEMDFSYRKLSPPFSDGLWCVVSAIFCMKKGSSSMLISKVKEIFLKKKLSQPITKKTCGCVFKNPVNYPAGYLLEKSGMKGKSLGGMMFSDLHANFLINKGEGTPSQAMEIIEIAKSKVYENFGIELDLEVKILS